jgi:hypothetical protein
MENKFMNLKKEYKEFIKRTAKKIKIIDIDNNLTKEKCIDIFKLFQDIYADIESCPTLNINDINHIIKNYNREDQNVELIKKFIKIKNLYLIKKTVKSPQWQTFILKLKDDIDLDDPKINKKVTEHLLSKGVFRLLNTTVDLFRGCWEIVEFNGDKIKKIEIIEPEHYEYLKIYLNNKLKK